MEFIALVLAIAALMAFRTLNKRTLALEERLSETSDALIALRASLGRTHRVQRRPMMRCRRSRR
jgi:biopolymer transport protein ExbB/TolQ